MNCKTAKNLMVLDLYGELSGQDKTRLDGHLDFCPACAAERDSTQKLFTLLGEHRPEPEAQPDWDRTWTRVQAGIIRKPTVRGPLRAPGWKWALAGTGCVLLLVAGIVIGRFAFVPSPTPIVASAPTTGPTPNGIRPAFASHLEDLKPLLLDYAHYTPGEPGGRAILIDEGILRGLILQNVLLKRKLADKNPAAADLLDDIDLVLREIVNRGARDRQSPAEIKTLIEQRDILFKMEILKKL